MQHPSPLNFKDQGQGPVVMLIHGLFGSLDNLGLLARSLEPQYRVISVDLRNHGGSFRSDDMSYPAQAGDILALMDQLELTEATLIGHSMGGKVAMQAAKLAPTRIAKLVVADIAPVAYPHARHQNVFAGLKPPCARRRRAAVRQKSCWHNTSRSLGCASSCSNPLPEASMAGAGGLMCQPLSKTTPTSWAGQPMIAASKALCSLLKGGDSDYMQPQYSQTALTQFPAAKVRVIAGTGHWLHAEKPMLFNKLVVDFLSTGG
ncbi:alpha/beta fold hydrolase [Aeromonas cavernicola]|uniref:alpha/beta fold hydrolase n=1 Tax=Aeromonas cavernicola TaxID=1006623 RepID=UPI001F47729C|nr:alpha/beta fold hydrolase [Aeromonas cavernicola]